MSRNPFGMNSLGSSVTPDKLQRGFRGVGSSATQTEQKGPSITLSWCQGVRSVAPARFMNHTSVQRDGLSA